LQQTKEQILNSRKRAQRAQKRSDGLRGLTKFFSPGFFAFSAIFRGYSIFFSYPGF